MDRYRGHSQVKCVRLNSQGQSVMEYILMLLVVVSLAALVFNSTAYKNIFGENSQIFGNVKLYMSYSYRHAGMEKGADLTAPPSEFLMTHESYLTRGGTSSDSSRIFLVNSVYPAN